MYIPYQQIVEKLKITKEDTLLISSDITKLAYTSIKNKERFDTVKFIESFESVLKNGLILFPAYNYKLSKDVIYNKNETVPEMGTLSLAAFNKTGYFRSIDPLHSFLIYGKNAKDIAEKEINSTFGEDSIFDFLKVNNAKMLLIDIDLQHSFTFIHYVEQLQKVSYRREKTIHYKLKNEKGELIEKMINVSYKKPGYYNTLNKLELAFIKNNIMELTEINGSKFQLINLNRAYKFLKTEFEQNNGKMIYQFDIILFMKIFIKSMLKK